MHSISPNIFGDFGRIGRIWCFSEYEQFTGDDLKNDCISRFSTPPPPNKNQKQRNN